MERGRTAPGPKAGRTGPKAGHSTVTADTGESAGASAASIRGSTAAAWSCPWLEPGTPWSASGTPWSEPVSSARPGPVPGLAPGTRRSEPASGSLTREPRSPGRRPLPSRSGYPAGGRGPPGGDPHPGCSPASGPATPGAPPLGPATPAAPPLRAAGCAWGVTPLGISLLRAGHVAWSFHRTGLGQPPPRRGRIRYPLGLESAAIPHRVRDGVPDPGAPALHR